MDYENEGFDGETEKELDCETKLVNVIKETMNTIMINGRRPPLRQK